MHIEPDLDIDGYEVTVTIQEDAIEGKLEWAEENRTEEINWDGLSFLDLSRFATVEAEPTDEKWKELAEIG